MIVYLHGFGSSPTALKAQRLATRLAELGYAELWQCPQLPASPAKASALIKRICNACAPADLTLIGSSLGGYYATWFAEQSGCRAVLLNPVTEFPRDAQYCINARLKTLPPEQSNDTAAELTAYINHYCGEFVELATPNITHPERYYLIAATGDEVLNYRDMLAKYSNVETTLIQGSNHDLNDFSQYLDQVLAFCGITYPSDHFKRVSQ